MFLSSKNSGKEVQILNDLIAINNDRAAGYKRALEETGDEGLKELFSQYIEVTRTFQDELSRNVADYGGKPEDDNEKPSSLRGLWLELQDSFSGNNRENVIAACVRVEEATKSAYEEKQKDMLGLPFEITELIKEQAEEQHDGYEKMKFLQKSSE